MLNHLFKSHQWYSIKLIYWCRRSAFHPGSRGKEKGHDKVDLLLSAMVRCTVKKKKTAALGTNALLSSLVVVRHGAPVLFSSTWSPSLCLITVMFISMTTINVWQIRGGWYVWHCIVGGNKQGGGESRCWISDNTVPLKGSCDKAGAEGWILIHPYDSRESTLWGGSMVMSSVSVSSFISSSSSSSSSLAISCRANLMFRPSL